MAELFDMILTGIRAALILLGLVGNLISFLVFSRPAFANNSISTYSRALAVFESYTLGQLITDMILLTNQFFYLANASPLWCKLSFYLNTAFAVIPGWILMAFSIDKIFAMKRRATFLKQRRVQYLIVLGLVLYNLLVYIEIPIFMIPVARQFYTLTIMICDTALLPFATQFNILHLVNGSLFPFCVMLVTSLVSIKSIRDSTKTIERSGADGLAAGSSSTSKKRRTSRDVKFAVTTITFNLLFVIMRLPIFVVGLMGYTNVSTYVTKFALLLFFVNSSMSICVHLVSNSLFRRELVFLFTRQSNRVESQNTQANSKISFNSQQQSDLPVRIYDSK